MSKGTPEPHISAPAHHFEGSSGLGSSNGSSPFGDGQLKTADLTLGSHNLPEAVDPANAPVQRTAGLAPAKAPGSDSLIITPAPYPATDATIVGDAPAPPAAAATEMPAPVQQAIEGGKPITFSSTGENQAAQRQPDYFLTPEGKLEANPNAKPSADGSINIEIQSAKPEDNKSLRDAIMHQTEMQKAAAKEMIRLFQKAHPGQEVPAWMNDLANAQPNLPDFAQNPTPAPQQNPTPPPENGFVNRGTSGRGSGSSGFAGNGGFDSQGNFRGNGGAGDGVLNTGGTDSKGAPLGPGETVQAKQLYDYLLTASKEQGVPLNEAQVSGILGNLQTESSFNTKAYNKGEGAIGLAQWEGGRRTNLERFAADAGKPVTDWKVQADFLLHELKGSESNAYSKIASAQTPSDAAYAFDKYFERSSGAARGQRMANAENIHRTVANA
ncbi:MAG: phage tail tip lysozyme [Candidatus Obscuribacterales bacterium]